MRRITWLMLLVAACSRGEQASSNSELTGSESVAPTSEGSGAASIESEVIGGDEPALREFIGRALSYHYPGASEGTRVLIGALPENLGFDLPIPEDSRVIGSIVRGPTRGGTEIILDVNLAPDQALAFYRDQLLSEDWEEQTQPAHSGGFVSGSSPSTTFCLEENEAVVFLSAFTQDGVPTELRLSITQDTPYYPCRSQPEGYDEASSLIPALESPPGSLIQSGGGSSGDGMAETTALLKTEISTVALAQHYAPQLVGAGWKPVAQAEAPELAWSSWSFLDEKNQEWSGLLVIFKSPVADERLFASFRVDRGG